MITELKSIGDIYIQMPSSDDARRFLEDLMWCDGRVCPHCGGVRSTELNGSSHRPGLYQCNECRGQFSITTKTPMHATKLDLRVWLAAIYTVLNSSKGISSVVLARMIGVSQKCAWKIGHAIREMMREDYATRPMLAGIVEVDETSVGGAPKYKKGVKNKRGKGTKKTPVMVAVERGGEARAAVLSGITGADFEPLICGWVAEDATLMTDGSNCYNFIPSAFPVHHRVIHSKKQFAIPATGAHVNTAEAFGAFIERARVGVYHRITGYHTQRYLDELTWRWNRREPVEQTRTDSKGRVSKHIRWKPLPVVQMMRFLLNSAHGRQMRRSDNYGLRWPGAASFGG